MHETAEDAKRETMQMLKVYEDFYLESLAIPAITGKKTEKDLVTNYYLSSMILYGQNHYTCLFYNKIIDKWSFVDDNNKKNRQ